MKRTRERERLTSFDAARPAGGKAAEVSANPAAYIEDQEVDSTKGEWVGKQA